MVGPTEFVRGGRVIETERLLAIEEGTGMGVPDGDGALGRLFLFSATVRKRYITIMIIIMLMQTYLVVKIQMLCATLLECQPVP